MTKRAAGAALLIFGLFSIFDSIRLLTASGDLLNICDNLIVSAAIFVIAVLAVFKCPNKVLMNTLCVFLLVMAVYYGCYAHYCFNAAAQIASETDEQLPGLNALAGITAHFSGYNCIANAIWVIILSLSGFLLAKGKKCGVLCILLGGISIVLALINNSLVLLILTSGYTIMAILLRIENKTDNIKE